MSGGIVVLVRALTSSGLRFVRESSWNWANPTAKLSASTLVWALWESSVILVADMPAGMGMGVSREGVPFPKLVRPGSGAMVFTQYSSLGVVDGMLGEVGRSGGAGVVASRLSLVPHATSTQQETTNPTRLGRSGLLTGVPRTFCSEGEPPSAEAASGPRSWLSGRAQAADVLTSMARRSVGGATPHRSAHCGWLASRARVSMAARIHRRIAGVSRRRTPRRHAVGS
jgi:hypothetical protein